MSILGVSLCKRATRSKKPFVDEDKGKAIHSRHHTHVPGDRMCVACPSELHERKMVTILCVL